jgi:hypothetical protein
VTEYICVYLLEGCKETNAKVMIFAPLPSWLQVWYCVSPKHSDKFERMAAQLFPEAHRTCPAFIRHKDLLISPAQLRTFGIPYMLVSALLT